MGELQRPGPREDRHDVRADGPECDVPQIEKAGESDDDVQPDGEERVRRRLREDILLIRVRAERQQRDDRDRSHRSDPPHGRTFQRCEHFSHVRSPKIPVGLTISTPTRRMKATPPRHWVPKHPAETFSITPRMRPPASAPLIEPIPPRTAAVNALMPGRKPIFHCDRPKAMPKRRPAAPASSPPMKNVTVTMRSMFTPMRAAASGSCAVARSARPVRVRRTNISSAITMTAADTTMMRSRLKIRTSPICRTACARSVRGYASGFTPRHTCTAYERNSDIPIALIK